MLGAVEYGGLAIPRKWRLFYELSKRRREWDDTHALVETWVVKDIHVFHHLTQFLEKCKMFFGSRPPFQQAVTETQYTICMISRLSSSNLNSQVAWQAPLYLYISRFKYLKRLRQQFSYSVLVSPSSASKQYLQASSPSLIFLETSILLLPIVRIFPIFSHGPNRTWISVRMRL